MRAVQEAFEQYRKDHGTYPSIAEWYKNELNKYVTPPNFNDPWNLRFHYQPVTEKGKIISYKLESFGENIHSSIDNIPCPIDTEKHRFSGENPIQILFPRHDEKIAVVVSEDGSKQGIALQANHIKQNVTLDWYIDAEKVGATSSSENKHELSVPLDLGEHILFLIDAEENNAYIRFYVEKQP